MASPGTEPGTSLGLQHSSTAPGAVPYKQSFLNSIQKYEMSFFWSRCAEQVGLKSCPNRAPGLNSGFAGQLELSTFLEYVVVVEYVVLAGQPLVANRIVQGEGVRHFLFFALLSERQGLRRFAFGTGRLLCSLFFWRRFGWTVRDAVASRKSGPAVFSGLNTLFEGTQEPVGY